ncbi:aminotransferase class I/II-fold pyridoxal phosphate-dependent enzyme [Streptomyces sp. NPDC048361]|uniref:aminotransferase class I/II-fold pyridoxal phosphate-dependent enzyme n=1 Tax=Streptomyces sp. NPDC048361 TaxID=3154720 RepID=UPI0034376F9E
MGSPELLIVLDRDGGTPLQQQLCEEIAALVRAGRLRPGDGLPASRALAGQLGVSRTVVTRAYELLRANGVITARQGSGTRVAPDADAVEPGRPRLAPPTVLLEPQPPRPTDGGDTLWRPWEAPPAQRDADVIDFRHGTPALAEFPLARWRQSLHTAYGRAGAASLGYGPAEGSPALRTEIATLVRRSRALDASPDQIMVTSGATQAMDILVRMLVGPGDVVVIEDPRDLLLLPRPRLARHGLRRSGRLRPSAAPPQGGVLTRHPGPGHPAPRGSAPSPVRA